MSYTVEEFASEQGEALELELCAGESGLKRRIYVPEVQRPGLSLSGYMKNHAKKRLLVFGRVEIEYLRHLKDKVRVSRLKALLTEKTPAVIVARRLRPPKELVQLCEKRGIPLFRAKMITMHLISRLTLLLTDTFAPAQSVHGSLVEVFGVGVLIQGDSSIGKSETALGLIDRGHRLISDDLVQVRLREGYLEGSGVELSRHHMEVRGIGILNVANLYGAVCVREKKSLDIVVKLEVWDDNHHYDRVGLEEKTVAILGVDIPHHRLPVKPGRDVVLLLETIALNHRLKEMGYHSAREFSAKLRTAIAAKGTKR